MAYRYKAFISYRHEALDIKVATEIQNCLERYHIPGSIRREKGIRSIGRIFRDKDELPSTSDLNDTIKEALVSSEFLICICSPAYTGSVWCRKELEFFLENHDKNHVLTVLADGDPLQVVPEILRMETVTFTAENGMTVTKEMPLEPLSCDWRMDRHRARTEELPRLAASLIGCRYADLRQKMRRRQMRIAAAAAGAGALLLAYFVWSYLG
ncbi:MAG: toll/interleukin-1 receptor domain-containing protein, partial [Lachnospiraceae bacterium]|nr:toll/interleukin-1 receptor domain-containing protein [Lachnospiraceae bacterium]